MSESSSTGYENFNDEEVPVTRSRLNEILKEQCLLSLENKGLRRELVECEEAIERQNNTIRAQNAKMKEMRETYINRVNLLQTTYIKYVNLLKTTGKIPVDVADDVEVGTSLLVDS